MRRIVLGEGARLDEKALDRSGAFDPDVLTSTAAIVGEVRKRGDAALREYEKKFDHVDIDAFLVSQEEIDAAFEEVDASVIEQLRAAAASIADFHERQKRESWFKTREDGALVGSKVTPIARVGIYVPGGRASYPSTVLMNAIPAKVAGVGRIVMVSPPTHGGQVDPATLVASRIAGVDEVYKVGGAQGIAALAYGTESIPRVDKVTGPGNVYVAAAKKLVSGDVGIDMIAGPSEVCIIAGFFARPEFVAIDLMAQAEHDPNARCYLVCCDDDLANDVEAEIAKMLPESPRAEITKASLDNNGVIIIAPTIEGVIDAVNTIAPEHLEVNVPEPMELLGALKNAGAIFLGEFTPTAVGDYVAGPNHTLPTSGTARFSSPLSVDDFVKHSSVIMYTYNSLRNDAATVEALAGSEGLWSHARSVSLRLEMAADGNNSAGDYEQADGDASDKGEAAGEAGK